MELHAGIEPLFGNHDQLLAHLHSSPSTLTIQMKPPITIAGLDERLRAAWQDIMQYCTITNLANKAQGRIPWDQFLRTFVSVMYPLCSISFGDDTLNEAIRLALLLISSHIFLQWKFITVPFASLSTSYKNHLLHLDPLPTINSRVKSWCETTMCV